MAARESIAVLGAGSWGATLASLLVSNGNRVSLWEIDAHAARILSETRRLKVLPELTLHPAVDVTSNLGEALRGRHLVVCAVPSPHVRSSMRSVRETGVLDPQALLVSVTKGLEPDTQKRMSEVILEELGLPSGRFVALSGPSHAEEVCVRQPTAIVASGADAEAVRRIRSAFMTDRFRIYPHGDLLGVELAASLKNVYAITCGISDGLGFGDNTRAALVTRGLNEMTCIGTRLGAELLTFFGLAGMGDMVVTCLSKHSRNHQLGLKIGQGKTPAQALAEMTMVAEGMISAPSAYALAQRLGLDCPLTRETYEILYRGKSPRDSLNDLMKRETQQEWKALTDASEGDSK